MQETLVAATAVVVAAVAATLVVAVAQLSGRIVAPVVAEAPHGLLGMHWKPFI